MSGKDRQDGSAGGLLAQIAGAGFRLLQGEIELRRAEAGMALSIVIRAGAMIVIALILALLGLGQLADAGHAALVMAGLGPVAASLVMGGLLCVLALGLGFWGLGRIRRAPFLAREARYLGRVRARAQAADVTDAAEEKEEANDRPV